MSTSKALTRGHEMEQGMKIPMKYTAGSVDDDKVKEITLNWAGSDMRLEHYLIDVLSLINDFKARMDEILEQIASDAVGMVTEGKACTCIENVPVDTTGEAIRDELLSLTAQRREEIDALLTFIEQRIVPLINSANRDYQLLFVASSFRQELPMYLL